MSRQKIVAGNWKMNTDAASAHALVKNILAGRPSRPDVLTLVFPPFPFLQEVNTLVKGEAHMHCGAQNCSEHSKGAYTGEVSAQMIRSVGAEYVLVGHSERRTYFKESHEQLRSKIAEALQHSLKVVYCFGEVLEERQSGRHFDTVKEQLRAVLSGLTPEVLPQLVLAYEPVWAIGTGETASPAQAQEMHAFVRQTMAELFTPSLAQSISILYGGSCNAQNAPELFACPDVDGGLIGGASLKAEDFCSILNSFA